MTKFHSYVSLYLGVFLAAAFCILTVPAPAQAPARKVIGTVKSVSGNAVVVTLDSGTEATVTFASNARIVRAAPGQTDLKSAPPIQVSDIQPGDRLVAKAQAGEGSALVANTAVVMSKTDITQKQQQERDEWRRGVGGIVKEVNIAEGTIIIPNSLGAAGKPIVIHVSPKTDIRRYAPDSVKFEDAKPSTLDQIKVGDQVRARGTKNEDGTEFTAQAIVSGSFREIAATVIATNAATNSVTITDLATKKPVTVKVGPDSMLRKLPQMMATGIAMRLKGINMPGAAAGAGAQPGVANAAGAGQGGSRPAASGGTANQGGANGAGSWQRGGPGGPGAGGWGGFRGGNGGPPDLQQMLARMPAMPVTDLNKGDAVILVATEGSSGSEPTVITMLAGVEPILTAAPAGTNAAATVLSPWNLGAGGGAEAAAGP
jgi:hypothetical protein